MTLLSTIQDVSVELGLVKPSTVITNTTDLTTQQLLQHYRRTGRELRSQFDWEVLVKEYTFTLSSGVASYVLPTDFERFAFMSHWDRSASWQMYGPVRADEWQFLKSAVTVSTISRRWRFKGYTTNQFFLDPTPGSADAGVTLVFEYYTKNWLRPVLWTTSTAFGAGTYTFYNGNYYSTSAGGTTGATPPTHVTGSASDGAVTWVYSSAVYDSGTADTDVSHIDENLIGLGTKWRYRQSKGIEGWDVLRVDYETEARLMSGFHRGARTLNLNEGRYNAVMPYPNIPEGSWS